MRAYRRWQLLSLIATVLFLIITFMTGKMLFIALACSFLIISLDYDYKSGR